MMEEKKEVEKGKKKKSRREEIKWEMEKGKLIEEVKSQSGKWINIRFFSHVSIKVSVSVGIAIAEEPELSRVCIFG